MLHHRSRVGTSQRVLHQSERSRLRLRTVTVQTHIVLLCQVVHAFFLHQPASHRQLTVLTGQQESCASVLLYPTTQPGREYTNSPGAQRTGAHNTILRCSSRDGSPRASRQPTTGRLLIDRSHTHIEARFLHSAPTKAATEIYESHVKPLTTRALASMGYATDTRL